MATTIPTLPPAPSRANDTPEQFSNKADALLGALSGFVTAANSQAGENNTAATNAAASAASAGTSASSATASASSATASQTAAAISASAAEAFAQQASGTAISSGTANTVAYLDSNKYLKATSDLTYNGSQLGVPPGTVTTPSLTTTGDTNTGLYFPAADTVAIATGGVKRVEVDASGNVGIGTTTGAFARLHTRSDSPSATTRPLMVDNGASSGTCLAGISFANAGAVKSSINAAVLGNDYMTFCVGGSGDTERARITSDGNLLVGTTSSYSSRVGISWDSSVQSGIILRTSSATLNGNPMVFQDSGGTARGSISQTASAVAYNTSSDYRLKENIQPMTDALAKVAALKPCTYTWKVDGSDGEGFIAHELAEVVPSAVAGEKDAVNDDGSIRPQGIDTSFLIATLTAALQEAHGLIKNLQARVDALEAK